VTKFSRPSVDSGGEALKTKGKSTGRRKISSSGQNILGDRVSDLCAILMKPFWLNKFGGFINILHLSWLSV